MVVWKPDILFGIVLKEFLATIPHNSIQMSQKQLGEGYKEAIRAAGVSEVKKVPPIPISPDFQDCQGRIKFSLEEDLAIKRHVVKHGAKKWAQLAAEMPNRNQRTIRQRWSDFLDPKLNHKEFSLTEDFQLWLLQKIFGNRWSRISKQISGRSPRRLKNHYRYFQSKARELCLSIYDFCLSHFNFQNQKEILAQIKENSSFVDEVVELINASATKEGQGLCAKENQSTKEENSQLFGSQNVECSIKGDNEDDIEEEKPAFLELQPRKFLEKSPFGLCRISTPQISTERRLAILPIGDFSQKRFKALTVKKVQQAMSLPLFTSISSLDQ